VPAGLCALASLVLRRSFHPNLTLAALVIAILEYGFTAYVANGLMVSLWFNMVQ
jgi:hypothetical protein